MSWRQWSKPCWQPGFLGAYTTFSTLALGDVLLSEQGAWLPALLYLVLSMPGGIGVVLLGDWLGQRFIARLRQRSRQAEAARLPHAPREQEDFSSPHEAETPRRHTP